jgi:hypothetical protein
MRQAFQSQPDLQITPIEKIRLPLKSRDELPPILAGRQWLWMHPTLKAEIFTRLEAKILAGKQATGRKGELSSDAIEGLNNKIRVVTGRSYGFAPIKPWK